MSDRQELIDAGAQALWDDCASRGFIPHFERKPRDPIWDEAALVVDAILARHRALVIKELIDAGVIPPAFTDLLTDEELA